jgi:DNA-binding NarL/FixJ family response regulator
VGLPQRLVRPKNRGSKLGFVAAATSPPTAMSGIERPLAVVLALDVGGTEVVDVLERGGLAVTDPPRGDDQGQQEPQLVVAVTTRIGGRALRAVRDMRRRFDGATIVLCSTSRPRVGVDEAIAAGADAVVELGELEALLPAAVSAARGGYTLRPRAEVSAASPLSARERQILSLVTLGFSNREIAQKLHLSESTIKSHLSSSFTKLGVRTRAEATARILANRDVAAGVVSIPGDHERLTFSRRSPTA